MSLLLFDTFSDSVSAIRYGVPSVLNLRPVTTISRPSTTTVTSEFLVFLMGCLPILLCKSSHFISFAFLFHVFIGNPLITHIAERNNPAQVGTQCAGGAAFLANFSRFVPPLTDNLSDLYLKLCVGWCCVNTQPGAQKVNGTLFLISTSILVMLIFISIAKAIRNSYMLFRFKRVRIKNLNRLNTEQLNTVVQLYYRPDHSANLDITHSTTALLESAKIIGRASSISVGGSYFSYFLQPWVINYINEHPEFTLNIPESGISHEFTSWY